MASEHAGKVVEWVQVYCAKCVWSCRGHGPLCKATEWFRERGWLCIEGKWHCPECIPCQHGPEHVCSKCWKTKA